MTTANEMLAELNAFRTAEGKAPFADWRKARHMPMLETYRAARFEASQNELAAQQARPSTQEAEGKAIEEAAAKKRTRRAKATTGAAPAKKDKTPTYKEIATYTRSTVLNPVRMIHDYLDANPGMGRKAAVQALVAQGVNYSTARTQYQRWFAKNKS